MIVNFQHTHTAQLSVRSAQRGAGKIKRRDDAAAETKTPPIISQGRLVADKKR